MIRILLTVSAALLSQAAVAQSVEVAEGNWSDIPFANKANIPEFISEKSMNNIDRLVGNGKCDVAGNRKRIDLKVPFIMQFDNRGVAQRVVLQRLGCPEVESVVAGIVLGRLKQGFYKPTGSNGAGWYRSEISYSLN